MFRFNFDIVSLGSPAAASGCNEVQELMRQEDDEEEQSPSQLGQVTAFPADSTVVDSLNVGTVKSNGKRKEEECHHVSLDELMEKLPSSISYSPLHLPFLPNQPLLRRDLFDARFQLAEGEAGPSTAAPRSTNSPAASTDREGEMDGVEEEEEEYVDSKTDLIPGLYEGGLKTWEGGVDLVEVIHSAGEVGAWTTGAKILEVGCGTAIPSSFILRHLLSSPSTPSSSGPARSTILHLQDYNLPVLSLVTLPNLILATLPFLPPSTVTSSDGIETDVESPAPDWTAPGEVALTPKVLEAVQQMWREKAVELKFSYGHWAGLASSFSASSPSSSGGPGGGEGYDLILTAETIYSLGSLPSLLQVLRSGQRRYSTSSFQGAGNGEDLEKSVEDLRLAGDDWKKIPLRDGKEGVVLVGAKVLYFGVGGDLHTFTQRVQLSGGWVEEVMKWTSGVGRKVVRVGW